jgi:hypothetical protein
MRRASCKSFGTAWQAKLSLIGDLAVKINDLPYVSNNHYEKAHHIHSQYVKIGVLIVTRLAWIAHKLQSSKRWTKKSSVACKQTAHIRR